ncbi:MAG: hypothetical protein R3E14_12095 [Erythrobacter sp.]
MIMFYAVFFFFVGAVVGVTAIATRTSIPLTGLNAFMMFAFLIAKGVLGRAGPEAPPLDEWQKTLRACAFLWGANIAIVAAIIFSFYLALVTGRDGWWVPTVRSDWAAIAFLIVVLWLTSCTFAAGWLTPAYAAELDLDD